MNKISKLWWGIIIVIVVIICWFWFGQRVFIHWQQQRIIADLEKVKDQYKQDQYGGATPEETLQMFIKAFKAGDLTLASKYFVPEKQAEYLAKMQNWVKLGKGEDIIKIISKVQKKGDESSGQVGMYAWTDGDSVPFIVEMLKNEFTGKWKLNNM